MKYNLPNLLSLSRIIISPIFFFLIISDNSTHQIIACSLFILGAITDYADGYFARLFKEVSDWGKFFDPLADKILTSAAFLALAYMGILPFWMALAIILRDVSTTFLRIFADNERQSVNTSRTAKWKTFLQMLYIFIIVCAIIIQNLNFNAEYTFICADFLHSNLNYSLMLGITVFTIYTGVEYFAVNWELTKKLWSFEPVESLKNIDYNFTTLYKIGKFPYAPGTVASLVSALIAFLPFHNIRLSMFTVALISFFLAIPSVARMEKKYGDDPGFIVIDEAVAMWLIYSYPFLPLNWLWIALAFVLFRFFDIVKPFPVNLFNNRKGALYVMLDDVVCAALTIICGHIIYYAMNLAALTYLISK